jgi:hypothetical protein
MKGFRCSVVLCPECPIGQMERLVLWLSEPVYQRIESKRNAQNRQQEKPMSEPKQIFDPIRGKMGRQIWSELGNRA